MTQFLFTYQANEKGILGFEYQYSYAVKRIKTDGISLNSFYGVSCISVRAKYDQNCKSLVELNWFLNKELLENKKHKRYTVRSETIFDNWKLFKNNKNAFYFTLKALFVLKVFKFLFWIFGHVEKILD